MNPHERIWKALNHEEPDRVPTFSQSIEQPYIERYDNEKGIPEEVVDDLFPIFPFDFIFAKAMGFDSKWAHLGGPSAPKRDRPEVTGLAENQTVNSAGQIRISNNRGQNWYHDGALNTPEMLKEWISYIKDFTVPAGRYDDFSKMYEAGKEKILPIPTIGGPVYTSWSGIGLRRFSYLARKYSGLVAELFNTWTELTVEAHKALFETGVDMVFVCDDFAQKDRLIISPKDFERFVKPNYKRLSDNAHKFGAKFLVHTDGNINEALPIMIEAGVDAAEPLEYESGMRLKFLKERFGDDIALFGNVPASDALCVGTREYTIEITKKCIKDAAEGGGFILSPGANILADSKVENVLAMIETVKKYGNYPIQL